MAKLLVVDDEKVLVKGLKFNLENEGYEVDVGYTGQDALDLARQHHYDLILLDLMMPKPDGLAVCMEIRTFSSVPIIMLTAKGEDTDKLLGFEYGADDYITKPFHILELKARVRALLRRAKAPATQAQVATQIVTQGDWRIDLESRTAQAEKGTAELTAKEFDLLALLMQHPGKVYSREQLLQLLWNFDYAGDYRTVDVHMRRLREKTEQDPKNPTHLLTKWGVGYYFRKD